MMKEMVNLGIKEQGFFEYINCPGRYADLINGTLFKGKQIVKAECLEHSPRKKSVLYKQETDEKTQKRSSSEKSIEYLERERDVLRLHASGGQKFYIGCEAQSRADYKMPARDFIYDGIEYADQLKNNTRRGKKTQGKQRTKRPLIPVFHLVLYLGETKWLSKYSLREMMDIPEEMKEFEELLPDYRICLADVHEQEPELFRTEWKDVFSLMRNSRKKDELKTYIETHNEELRKLSQDTRLFLAILLEQYEIMENGNVEVRDVCKAWDGAMLMYKDEGIAEGENRVNSLVRLLMREKRYADLARAAEDREYQKELFETYHL